MSKLFFKHSFVIRILIVSMALFTAPRMFGLGFTPTDGGLVVNLQPGQRILLSTMVNGQEYFVCHYPGYTGGYFRYTNWDSNKGNFLKLIPQAGGATEPASPSIWTIDTALTRIKDGKNYALGGIAYTMWSTNPGGDSYTLLAASGWKYQGDLTSAANVVKNANACDVVFVAPTNRASVTSFDPKRTLTTYGGRTDQDAEGLFNGEKGYGFLGLPYREVYMLATPRFNEPIVYGNAALIGFNTTTTNYNYNNGPTAKPGQALFAFTDRPKEGEKYVNTRRTIFRLYVLDEPVASSCPDSYFFAYDEQDFVKYRLGPGNAKDNVGKTWTDSTDAKQIYTIDRLECMERLGETKYYLTDYMFVPEPDNTYFYVGYQNKYCHKPGDAFDSQFKNIDSLKIHNLGIKAPRGAYGQMMIDTTQTSKQNLGVEFQPAGYFLRTNTGRNIRLIPSADYTTWTCEEMWHITAEWAALTIKATMFTGSEFSEDDPGADIPGWSVPVTGTSVPVVGGGSIIDRDGWARIHVDSKSPNGAIEFVPANPDRHIHYDNNGFVGLQIPDQYPLHGQTSVTVENHRLVGGFVFHGWATSPNGDVEYNAGDVIDLEAGTTTLYAKATYTGTIHVALSFLQDGKRYFLTHPGQAPRFAHARPAGDWTNMWQGMANIENADPNYINTYKLKNDFGVEQAGEYVLDPQREMRHGAKDSLLFYEYFAPEKEEYIGLYFTDPNTMLSNNTWAGLFTSTNGWPDYSVADVQNTKLKSTHYVHRVDGVLRRDERSNSSEPFVKYNPAANQFEGVATADEATTFQLSRVRVADEHYVVIPDTTDEWRDEIVFDYHSGAQTEESVWSKLIGKQLMAVIKVGNDTIYFHPNQDKILTTAPALRLSTDYRLSETFTYIRDRRVTAVAERDRPHMSETGDEFGRRITSGMNSPIDVFYNGEPIDICDTLRITLRPTGTGKIKDYYGRWHKDAPGLHIAANGTRYRDIIVRTKTYRYGEIVTHLKLRPKSNIYNFSPLAGVSKRLDFTLEKVRARQLLDVDGNPLAEVILSSEDVTTQLHLTNGDCRFAKGGTFDIVAASTLDDHITLTTRSQNTSLVIYDTLVIESSATVDDVNYPVTGRVPLTQATLGGNEYELIWSVANGDKQRYYIMAGSEGLIFRQFKKQNAVLYKNEDGRTKLIKGAANAANDQTQYITPWKYTYVDEGNQQLTLKTEQGINKYFVINSSALGDVANSGPTVLTYVYDTTYTNDNANFEEQVRLKYGDNSWLKFEIVDSNPRLAITNDENAASVFSWSYLLREYNLLNNGTYPSRESVEFGYNSSLTVNIQTCYKAYREYSMLVGNEVVYCCREDETNMTALTSPTGDWKTAYNITRIPDGRTFDGAATSGLSISTNTDNLTTTISQSPTSPTDVTIGGKYVNIVDTLDVALSLQSGAPAYKFKDKWSSFTSINDAHLKIPLVRKTYHTLSYDSLVCLVNNDEYNHTFPATIVMGENDTHTFTLRTEHRTGSHTKNVDNQTVAQSSTSIHDDTEKMRLNDAAYAEVRLIDEYGNTPSWCQIKSLGSNTITVKCTGNGIRAPQHAYIYIAYMISVGSGGYRYINFRLYVAQLSRYQSSNNQTLVHSTGITGDPMVNGMQQTHENKNIIYYYNPSNAEQSTDQRVELPVRERNFYGWWRWYEDTENGEVDIPAEKWETAPTNTGKANFPFRIIGDSVDDGAGGKKLVTMGRYTVFRYPAKVYDRNDPPAKSPLVYPPTGKQKVTYAVDLSNYYDNLPLSMKNINEVDTAMLDTMINIIEPTLSLREIFELHPWTEMADSLEHYKDTIASSRRNLRYWEDHVVMAPTGNRLLLSTEQRYNYDNVKAGKHSESLLGYYMHDDNWETGSWDATRKDSMIWCGGWDVDCKWYTYNPSAGTYTECKHSITKDNDYLQVPVKANITAGKDADTVYYCLRARSVKSTHAGTPGDPDPATPEPGLYWFNICRYTVIYHRPERYGPLKEETVGGVTKALITNDEIEQHYEVLERLNFDYNKPGSSYQVYPHPLPWADASYGYTYPETPDLPHNRYHSQSDFPNMGEYGLINRIPYSDYWHKMEQHGGAANGYMIYCDGMSSSGQVAAFSLEKRLCEGQKMYFSGYVGNPSNQGNKAKPNFLFSVQGSSDGSTWEDITSYMTGDIPTSDKWYQIFFPIDQKETYNHFRVRVFNMSSDNDGNDFTLDDMCIFATKPPLIAYQANTTCMAEGENDSTTHVVLRVDYQGFNDEAYNNHNVYYTVEQAKGTDTTLIKLIDGYIHDDGAISSDTIGCVHMPLKAYTPTASEIYTNISDLVAKFESSLSGGEVLREGYMYENLDGDIRPVLYIIHKAKVTPKNRYQVRMSLDRDQLRSSICAMTSALKISNRMTLVLNNEEQDANEVGQMCANTINNISLRVKGELLQDNSAPVDINGSCFNDWLLYGDTTEVSSEARYGYKYSDICKVIKDILRHAPESGTNSNQFARNLAAVSRNEMIRIQGTRVTLSDPTLDPYTILSDLVRKGFLTLYQSNLTLTTASGDSTQYMIFPILGTGSDAMLHMAVEVCPTPVFVKLKSTKGDTELPMSLGEFASDTAQIGKPKVFLFDATTANREITIHITRMSSSVVLDSIVYLSTNDPNFLPGVHKLNYLPDKVYNFSDGGDNSGYYVSGNNLILTPAPDNNYTLQPGYDYTFCLTFKTRTGLSTHGDGCPVGVVPITVSVVPDRLRWNPQAGEDNSWNNPENWIGVDQHNRPIHDDSHYAPLATSSVIIPALNADQPYPVVVSTIDPRDSVKQTGFEYNKCKDIRFLPGAAISGQELLTYDNAVVDMGIPKQTWALRSAPVTGMLSGDIYMSDADLMERTSPWEVGEFDTNGRNYNTGNASFWLSLFSRETTHYGVGQKDSTATATAEWSKVTNGLTLSLPPAMGWAVYTRTASGNDAAVRLPKNDDIYYYYTIYGEKVYDAYESGLRTKRGDAAAGKLAFDPTGTSQVYRLSNEVAANQFVFGNPSMGYIDIWGFIADNSEVNLEDEFDYIDASGKYTTITKDAANGTPNVITTQARYLPPMHAIVVKLNSSATATSLDVTLNASRVVTSPVTPAASAPARSNSSGVSKGIMTVTAINPVSNRCTSRLLIGQGYSDDVISGEDAVLTTVNIDNFSMTNAPSTPFNIYATEGSYGLSIDLRGEVLNVPIAFFNSDLPYDPVTQLWFTGVNNIDGQLVLYDALTDSERLIIDGIRLDIPTPDASHEKRYYIRRRGFDPSEPSNPVATAIEPAETESDPANKIIHNGHVYILRNGHVYTMFGQKLR